MQIPDDKLEAISDPATRPIVGQLLYLIALLVAENAALHQENQQLRDENARRKGGSGKPAVKPPVPPAAIDHSSEVERRERTPRGQPKKHASLLVTHELPCVVAPSLLPPDARRHDTAEVILHDLVRHPEVIRFVRGLAVSLHGRHHHRAAARWLCGRLRPAPPCPHAGTWPRR